MLDVAITRHTGTGAPEIQPLVDAAGAEGFAFVARTVDEWASGVNRFDRANEAFFLATAE